MTRHARSGLFGLALAGLTACGSSLGSGGGHGGAGGAGNRPTSGAAGVSGGGGTGGGAGTGVACTSASTCPGGADTACQRKTCTNNLCGLDLTAAGTVIATQTAGDCHRNVCDGAGNVMSAIFDTDTPADDGNACTDEICVNGLPSHPPEPARTACTGAGGAMLCNGSSSAPACVVCVAASDCPGTDSICQKRVCGNQNTCGFSNAAAGTDAEPDATGNCKKAVCNSTGGVTSANDDTDTPNDGNACTTDTCASGAPVYAAKADGVACTGTGGGTVCASGVCVQCLTAANCPGSDTICRQRTCATNHTCGHTDANAGVAAEPDATGNCQKAVCNGTGGVTSMADDTDKPVDGDACTKDVCTNGAPTNPALAAGTLCASDESKACDAAGACNALTFRVVRIGTGSASVDTDANAVFIEERRTDGSLVATVALPVATSGAQRALTMSRAATSEGALSLSADGRYLMLAGYGTAPGTANVIGTSAATVNRVAGRIDVTGAINTTTSFATATSGNNVRAATSTDGSELWIAGAGNTNGGVWYNQTGATTNETHTLLTPDSVRAIAIFGDQLYGSSADSPFVFRIGFGTPTGGSQSATGLTGLPTSGTNPYAFAFFDVSAGVPGLDTLYVAEATTGLRKYTYNGTSWTAGPTLNIAGNAVGFRGVAGYVAGTTVTLMASTAEATNRLVVFVDTGVGTPTGNAVATAATNTVFRGVAASPHFPPP